jgi:hypothetical protein
MLSYTYIVCLILKQNNSYTQIQAIRYFSKIINTSGFLKIIHAVIKLQHLS